MLNKTSLRLIIAGVLAISAIYAVNVFASHDFEFPTQPTFVSNGNRGSPLIPDNTHIRLDGLTLPPRGFMALYDASPNYVAGHLLLTTPCTLDRTEDGMEIYRPTVTVIAGHIDEKRSNTHVMPIPLYYIPHASNPPRICTFHAHVPDPVSVDPIEENAPRVTDILIVNNSDRAVRFLPIGYVVDINIQRVLGSIGSYYETFPGNKMLPSDIINSDMKNPVFVGEMP